MTDILKFPAIAIFYIARISLTLLSIVIELPVKLVCSLLALTLICIFAIVYAAVKDLHMTWLGPFIEYASDYTDFKLTKYVWNIYRT